MFYRSRKTFEIRGSRLRIFKSFEITKTIYSSSERSEQFLVTKCFFNLFLEISEISKNRTIMIQIGKKILGFSNLQEKIEKDFGHSVQFFPLSIKVATFRKTAVNSGSFILRYVAHV